MHLNRVLFPQRGARGTTSDARTALAVMAEARTIMASVTKVEHSIGQARALLHNAPAPIDLDAFTTASLEAEQLRETEVISPAS